MSKQDTQVFSKEEADDLDLVRTIRRDIISDLTEDSLPTGDDLYALTDIISDLEKGALSVAKIRIAKNKVEGENTDRFIIAALLDELGGGYNKNDHMHVLEATEGDLELPSSLDTTPVPGELTQESGQLYEEIFGPEDD